MSIRKILYIPSINTVNMSRKPVINFIEKVLKIHPSNYKLYSPPSVYDYFTTFMNIKHEEVFNLSKYIETISMMDIVIFENKDLSFKTIKSLIMLCDFYEVGYYIIGEGGIADSDSDDNTNDDNNIKG